MKRFIRSSIVVLLAALGACAESTPSVVTVFDPGVTPSNVVLGVSGRTKLTFSNGAARWTTANQAVATVDVDGVVTARGEGTTAIVATSPSNAALAAAAAVTVIARDTMAAFQTDSMTYTLDNAGQYWMKTINLVWSNPSSDSLFINGCGYESAFTLEKQEGASWVTAYHAASPLCGPSPTISLPGQRMSLATHVIVAYPETPNASPKFIVSAVPGVYRWVVSSVYRSYKQANGLGGQNAPVGPVIEIERRVSNRFVILTTPH